MNAVLCIFYEVLYVWVMLTITETKKNIRHNNLWDYCYWLLFPCLKLMPPGSITKNQDVFIDIFLIFLFRTEYLSFFILKKIAALLFSNKKKIISSKEANTNWDTSSINNYKTISSSIYHYPFAILQFINRKMET